MKRDVQNKIHRSRAVFVRSGLEFFLPSWVGFSPGRSCFFAHERK